MTSSVNKSEGSGRTAVAVLVSDENREWLPGSMEEWRRAGSELEWVLVDQTLEGSVSIDGASVLREPLPSRGLAWQRVLEATDAEWIAWHDPRVNGGFGRIERQRERARAHPELRMVTCAVRERGPRTQHAPPPSSDFEPGAFWQAGALVHRSVLATIDVTCFAPVELELHERMEASDRAAHLCEPVLGVEPEHWEERAEEAALDVELRRLARGPRAPELQVSVLMACYERWPVLLKCLEGFSRQLVPPGSLEIIVCDDGSTDATPRLAPELRLPVPLHYSHRPNAGACAARNRGLPLVRAPLTLFVNDDTIPFADTVQRHLDAHRELEGERVAVLGTFEQPPREVHNSLTRLLERSTLVFGYAGFRAGEVLGGEHFYTCNASVPTEAVRALGPFDESFPCFAEDTDYGMRLQQLGYRLVYRPEVRSQHHHVLSLDDFRARQHKVALAHIRLYSKHPSIVPTVVEEKTVADLRKSVTQSVRAVPLLEAAAQSLAQVDLAALEAMGGSFEQTARSLEGHLDELVHKLNSVWWCRGLLAGFEQTGGSGFPELLGRSPEQEVQRV